MSTEGLEGQSILSSNGVTRGWVLIRKKRKRFSLPGASAWKRRYIAVEGSIVSTFSSEAAYNKCCEAETKHTVHVDPSCTCAPSTEVSEGTVFVLTSPREKGDNSSLICMAFNRREMQRWVSAIGRAIHYSIDSNTAKEILQRHPNSSSSHGSSHVIQSKDGNFDPSALNSLLRRKSLSTIETSAIRQLMVSLKNEKSNSTTSTTSTTTTTTTTTS